MLRNKYIVRKMAKLMYINNSIIKWNSYETRCERLSHLMKHISWKFSIIFW